MSIITGTMQAMLAARTLDQNQESYNSSLQRLSSGSKIANAAEDPAGLAVSGKLTAQNLRVQAASTNVQNAISYLQTSDGFMSNIGDVLSRLGELSTLAQDPTKSASDISLYQQQFSALQDQLRTTIGGSTAEIGGTAGVVSPLGTFSGTQLFGSSAGPTVSIGADSGQSLVVPTTNLRTGAMAALISQDASGNYTATLTTPGVGATITNATQQVATQRAAVGASEARLNLAGSTLQVESQNLTASISSVSDVDVAQESTQLAKYNVLVQAGTAMLAQANQISANVLKLLK